MQAEIYSGAIFMQQLLGWNMYLCVFAILAVTAVYTVAGKPVHHTDLGPYSPNILENILGLVV